MEIVAPAFLSIAFAWVAILAALAALTFFAENNAPGRATMTLVGTLAALQLLSPIKPIDLFFHNTVAFVGLLLVYVAIGIGYGVLKWFSYARHKRDDFLAAREEYKRSRWDNSVEMGPRDLKAMDEWVLRKLNLKADDVPVKIAKNKARFVTWAMYWPMSAAWTFFNDPVRRAFNAIYNHIAVHLQAISDKVFAGVTIHR
jgi:hypothetical protein